MMKYPVIHNKPLKGDEPLLDLEGNEFAKLSDFWSWAYSDLIANAERGVLAEYIVACALGVEKSVRISWDNVDLRLPEGIAVEVKSSGYIQTWEQDRISSIRFGIKPTYGWDAETNKYGSECLRQSDIYIFCVHKHTDQNTINPLDVRQWDFYIILTDILDKSVGEQKSITLSALVNLGAEKCEFDNLHRRILCLLKS